MPPKPKSKIVQACKAMKHLGYSEKTVRPILKQLLNLYEDNWMLIEEDNFRVLVEAILDSTVEQKAPGNELKQPETWSEDEAEGKEPLAKKPRISSRANQSSPFFSSSVPFYSNEVENQTDDKHKLSEFTSDMHRDKDFGVKTSHVPILYQRRKKTSTSSHSRMVDEQETEYTFISDDENDEFNSVVPFEDLENRGDEFDLNRDFSENNSNPYELLSDDHPSFEVPLAVLPPDLEYPEVIDLDEDDDEDISHDLELNRSESMNCKNSEAEKDEHDARDTLKLDIASSSRGEAKISLSINASLRPGFRVPSLEAVLKKVEEQCLKSFKIPQADFSLMGLMKQVCESYLAAGTSDENTESLGHRDEISSLSNLVSEDTNDQLSLPSKKPTVANDHPDITRNEFEVPPRISRFFGSVRLDLCRPLIYLRHSSAEIVVFQEKHGFCYINDITKGHEDFEISLINEVNEDECPPFKYISKNVTYNNAHVRFPLARISKHDCCSNCFGDCLSLDTPCACAGRTASEFAYTPKGLMNEKFLKNFVTTGGRSVTRDDVFYCREDCPLEKSTSENSIGNCKGHVNRKFVKECWYKCGCSMNCGNRVVQQGIKAKLQVFMTPDGKRWGLRTLEDLPRGAFICEYVGEVVTIGEMLERKLQNNGDIRAVAVVLDADWSCRGVLKDSEALCLDATVYGNIARFINSRCFDANLVGVPVEVESPDRHYYHLAFFTAREVHALEELTWDYGVRF